MAPISISTSSSSSSTLQSRFLCCKTLHHPKPSLLLRPLPGFPSSIRVRFALRAANPRTPLVGSIRASIEVPAGIRPGRSVETDKLPSDVRNGAMKAVDHYGGRVTIGDIASKAGLKLNEAERALQALAADSGGFLEVSDEGDVLYVFPKDYRSKLAAKSFKMKLEPVLDKVKGAASYLIRVSFGTALIASIVLVYTTIIVLLSSRSESEDNRGRRRSGSDFTILMNPSDLFWYWDTRYYTRRQRKSDNGMNFVESVFSFVFGDEDPNLGFEEKRWKLIGEYIASNGGVVAAEELAPYLDSLPTDETQDDESYILPVLLRFGGHPEVDDEGNILYIFPSFQRTASAQRTGKKEYVGRKWADWVDGVERFLEEKKLVFSKTGASERAMVVGLGAFNLFGVVVLGSMLKNLMVAPEGLVSFVVQLFPLLLVYAGSFFAIPVVRWFLLQKTNADIEKRNQARKQQAQRLELPNPSLRKKEMDHLQNTDLEDERVLVYKQLDRRNLLLNARDMSTRTIISSNRILYSTDKDFSEQDYESREWDKRFRELDRSE